MIKRLIAILVLLAPALLPQDAAVAETIEKLEEAQKGRDANDQIHFTKILAEKWEAADEDQRKDVLRLMQHNMKNRDKDIRAATVEALAKMKGGERDKWGDISTKLLAAEAQRKETEDDVAHFGNILRAIGDVGHKRGVPVLTKLLHYKDYDVVAAAAEGLGRYKDADLDEKKEIVKELLKTYTSVDNQYRKDPGIPTYKERFDKINRPMEVSLKALTGQNLSGSDAWWNWWNDDGKKARSWDT